MSDIQERGVENFLNWIMANRDVPARKWTDEIEPELVRQLEALIQEQVRLARIEENGLLHAKVTQVMGERWEELK